MATAERETKLYECEVKRRRVKEGGGYEPFWKTKNVTEALIDADTEFRCQHCFGAVKLFRSHKADGPGSHVEHKSKQDSEYCPAGLHFRKSTDGREPRQSEHPVL
jgi:hypothetical protein